MYWVFFGIETAVIAAGVILAFIFRAGKPVVVVDFAPPEAKILHFSAFWHGRARKKDLSAVILQWARLGCVTVEKDGKRDVILIKKTPLPEGRTDAEHKYFDALFSEGDEFSSKSLHDGKNGDLRLKVSYAVGDLLDEAKTPVVYARGVVAARAASVVAAVAGAFTLIMYFAILNADYGMLMFTVIITLLFGACVFAIVYIAEDKRVTRGGSITSRFLDAVVAVMILLFVAAPVLVYSLFMGKYYDLAADPARLLVISLLWIAVSAAVAHCIMTKRTEEGTRLYGKMLGFKRFIRTAELARLETLLKEIPDYYDEILPYCLVLGLSGYIDKKFAYILSAAPEWAKGFDIKELAVSVCNAARAAVRIRPHKRYG